MFSYHGLVNVVMSSCGHDVSVYTVVVNNREPATSVPKMLGRFRGLQVGDLQDINSAPSAFGDCLKLRNTGPFMLWILNLREFLETYM